MNLENNTPVNLVNLTIDGRAIAVPKGTAVYAAAKKLGIELPIFCFQDRMPAFGACRVCLVEVEKMPKLQTSCTLEASEGMVVRTQTNMALEGRKNILELLLINHPLDCPICDRAGECPLQDQTVDHGPGQSRFFEIKRRFKKALPLGPVLMLDRERCISCARCTRFGDIIAGDHALEFVERGYRTEVGTCESGPAKSKFIGNTIMICPVGALTSQVYRFKARPWDNQTTESTCTLCSVGCNLAFDSRDDEIMRTRSSENRDLNDIWLCDKGWFGYEFAAHPDRLQQPLVRRNGKLVAATWDEALDMVAIKLGEAKSSRLAAGLGGTPLTVEENFLFQHLIRAGTGSNNVDYRVAKATINLEHEGAPPGMEISIGACEELSSVLLLGVDLTEEFPLIWLRLKQAVNRGAGLTFGGHYSPEISQYFSKTAIHPPGQELSAIEKLLPHWCAQVPDNTKAAIFVGRQYLDLENRFDIISRLNEYRRAGISINIMEGSGNSMGARYAGMHPQLAPMGKIAASAGQNAQNIFKLAEQNAWKLMYVAGANPAATMSAAKWKSIRSKLEFLVVHELFLTKTAEDADVVFPTLCHIEKSGSFITIEGRVQTLRPAKASPVGLRSDGEIFSILADRLGVPADLAPLQDKLAKKWVTRTLVKSKPSNKSEALVPSDTHLRATLAPSLFDHGERMQRNEHALQLASLPWPRINPREAKRLGLIEARPVIISVGQIAVTTQIKVDKGVALGTIVLPTGFPELPVGELNNAWQNGFLVHLKPLE